MFREGLAITVLSKDVWFMRKILNLVQIYSSKKKKKSEATSNHKVYFEILIERKTVPFEKKIQRNLENKFMQHYHIFLQGYYSTEWHDEIEKKLNFCACVRVCVWGVWIFLQDFSVCATTLLRGNMAHKDE